MQHGTSLLTTRRPPALRGSQVGYRRAPLATALSLDTGTLLGREVQCRAFGDFLAARASGPFGAAPNVLVISGAPRTGRSTFASWCLDNRPPRMAAAWISGGHLDDRSMSQLDPVDAERVVVIDDFDRLAPDDQRLVRRFLEAANDRDESVGDQVVLVTLTAPPDWMHDETDFAGVRLGPLSSLETFTLVGQLLGGGVDPEIADEIHQRTGGRPGAVRDVVNRLLRGGGLRRTARGVDVARLKQVDTIGLALPHALMAQLSEPACRLVEIAACLGEHGLLDDLRDAVMADGCPDVGPVFDEVASFGMLDDDGSEFWFPSAEVVDAISGALSSRRVQSANTHLARIVAERGAIDERRADQLVRHLRLAATRFETAERIRLALLAAGWAEDARRWAAASAALDIAIDACATDDPRRVNLLRRSAEARFQFDDPGGAVERFEQAADEAARTGIVADGDAALLRALSIRAANGMGAPAWSGPASADPTIAAWYVAAQADQAFARGDVDAGERLAIDAARLARDAGEPDVEVYGTLALGNQRLLELRLDAARVAYRDCAAAARSASDPLLALWPRIRLVVAGWVAGRDRDSLADARAAGTGREGWWGETSLCEAVVAATTFSSGDLDDALRFAHRSYRAHRRSGYAFSVPIVMPVACALGAYQSRADIAEAALASWERVGHVPSTIRDLVAVHLHGHRATDPGRRRSRARADLFGAGIGVAVVELDDWLSQFDESGSNVGVLSDLAERGIVNVPGWPVTIARAASIACRHAGDDRAANELARLALDHAAEGGAVVAEALSTYDLARWAPADGDSLPALVAAADRFAALRLTVWLGRAEADIDAHPEAGRLADLHPPRVLVYTDLVGSTALNVRSGDRRFIELVAEHQAIVDECVVEYRGARFHSSGDGFGLWFADARSALECADELHRRFDAANRTHPDLRLEARIGVAAGNPVPFDGDLYGLAVVRAARVCQAAQAGTTLASDEVLDLPIGAGRRATLVTRTVLKGFDSPNSLYLIQPKET